MGTDSQHAAAADSGTAARPWPTCSRPPQPRSAARRRRHRRATTAQRHDRRCRTPHSTPPSSTRRPSSPSGTSSRSAACPSTAGSARRPTGRSTRPAGRSVTGCCATTPSGPCAATTSSTCRTGCTSSATTPARSTASSGRRPRSGLRTFQRDYGLTSDGTCGPATLRALRQLGRKVTGGRPQLLRQSASFVESGPHLIGRRIVVDPGHGGEETGYTAGETTEADLVFDLASRIEGRLAAAGATVYLTRGRDQNPPLARAHRVRQRRPRRPLHLAAPGRAHLRARPRGRQLLLRHRLGRLLHRRASSSPTSPAAR